MKIVLKQYKLLVFCSLLLITTTACNDLDYTNTKVITPDNVWKDATMIKAYLSDIYGEMLPAWPINGNDSDEALNNPGSMTEYLRGILSEESTGVEFKYGNIDKINFFLDQMQEVPESVLSKTENSQLVGQALFWRAWAYWDYVNRLGGVPLILKTQNVADVPSLFVPRNSTSECVARIIQDLDDAISMLPATWTGADYGRIDGCAAIAFKGRVLLWYASPLFNPSNDQSRWQDAYKVNADAVAFLKNAGKGLYPKYNDIWNVERNQEVIMVNQYYYPDHSYDKQNYITPEPLTKDASNNNQPIMSLLNAFPLKDGSALQFDKDKLSDPAYNAQYLTDFYTNRDDRFYTTVFCGGTRYPSKELAEGVNYWCVWKRVADDSSPAGFKYISLANAQMNKGGNYATTGFFQYKGLDLTLNIATIYQAGVDWVPIRYAEVLMNFGECANETGKTNEALQVLYDIRKRAGIEAGTGAYGITATTQNDIREAYILERSVEFAFEGFRLNDLRRWRRYGIINNQKFRSGVLTTLNADLVVDKPADFDWTQSIMDATVRQKFHAEFVENLDGDSKYQYNLDTNTDRYFYPIKPGDLSRNSKLEQNKGWGNGTFDPLK